MEFLVLGPIEVRSVGSLIRVGGVKQRSILALLVANRGRVVSTDRIVVDVYGEDAGSGDGYVFDAPRDAVDVCRFEDGVAEGLGVLGDDQSSTIDTASALNSSVNDRRTLFGSCCSITDMITS